MPLPFQPGQLVNRAAVDGGDDPNAIITEDSIVIVTEDDIIVITEG